MNTIRITRITHSRHQHELRWKELYNSPYICDGCQDLGSGPRFSCPNSGCNFNVHGDCCSIMSQDVTIHPFLNGTNSRFVFVQNSSIRRPIAICNACKEDMRGRSYYRCSNTQRHLHLSCARLPSVITKNINNQMSIIMTLKQLYQTKCSYPECPSVNGGWSYFSSDDRYSLHVRCWKHREMTKLNQQRCVTRHI